MNFKISLRYLFILLIAQTSCHSNDIYFDLNAQSVITCSNIEFSKIQIISDDDSDVYIFTKLSKEKGTNDFNLVLLNKAYILENELGELSTDSFKLRPNMVYIITNSSNGDAASDSIHIKTDDDGKVVEASNKSCE